MGHFEASQSMLPSGYCSPSVRGQADCNGKVNKIKKIKVLGKGEMNAFFQGTGREMLYQGKYLIDRLLKLSAFNKSYLLFSAFMLT